MEELNISEEIIEEAKLLCPYHPTIGSAGYKRMNRWKYMYYKMNEQERQKIKINHYTNKICDLKRRLNYLELEIPRIVKEIEESQKKLDEL